MKKPRYGALLALLLALLGMMATAHPAWAHALVERSEPPAYRLVLKPPDTIVLYFSEPIDPQRTWLRVLTQEGRRVDGRVFQLSADRRMARLPVRLPGPGIYTVTWLTRSLVDQHTYEGFFTFTAGPLRPGSFTLQAGVPMGPSPWEVATRWLIFLGAAVLGGGLLMHGLLLPSALRPGHLEAGSGWILALNRRWRVAAWSGAAGFLVGTLAEFGFQAARAAALASEGLWTTVVQLVSGGPLQISLMIRIAAPVVLLAFVQRDARRAALGPQTDRSGPFPSRARTLVGLAFAAVLPLGISLTSHAAASQSTLPLIADWLHLAGVVAWVGGLIYLVTILIPALRLMEEHDRIEFLGLFAQRFSNLFLAGVSVLLATGVYASWLNVPSLRAASSTMYGRTLAVKLALLLPLLGIAAVNLLLMRPRLAHAANHMVPVARALALVRRFSGLVRSEVALASVVLLAAAVLALLPTARQIEALAPSGQSFVLVRSAEGLDALLHIEPYQVGETLYALQLRDRQGRPVSNVRVRFTFLALASHLGSAVADGEPQGDGRYQLRGGYVGTTGPWLITVSVRLKGKEDVTFLYPVESDWERGTPVTPSTDPRALSMLREADQAMNRLRSMRLRQELADGRGGNVVVFSEFAAPNAIHYRVIGGSEGVLIGERRFTNDGGAWRELSDAPFKFPNFTFAENADHVVFGSRQALDGIQTQIVVFMLKSAGASARYVVWIDVKSHRIIQEAMIARAHYMTTRNYDFDLPVKIGVPISR